MTVNNGMNEIPQAVLTPERRWSWFWVLPALALVLAGWLAVQTWSKRGTRITVQFMEGHGLRAEDEVRYRGIVVGRVHRVSLSENQDGVIVTANLHAESRQLARAGTRLWVVRPQLGITGIAGLETLVGPRYLALLPGDGPPQRAFVGLLDPPVVEAIAPGDLEIVLRSNRRGSMRPGAPVLYRQVPVGTILSIGLDHDAGAVIARVHVPSRYTALVRERTRFWNVGGLDAEVGLRGLSLKLESVETLLAGGVALATPPAGGEVVHNGHQYVLDEKPQPEWLEWQPRIAVGTPLLPPGSLVSAPLRAVLGWSKGRWLKSERARRGWVIQMERGLLGPADLLDPGGGVDAESAVLEIEGETVLLTTSVTAYGSGLARMDFVVTQSLWPDKYIRAADQPEDCVVIGDRAVAPILLTTTRLTAMDGAWAVDPAVAIDESWHGACVLARRDGRLLGLLLVKDDSVKVALLPASPNR